jgi:hypothetical protein
MNARRFIPGSWLVVLLLLVAVCLGCVACETTEPDNESVKPWNSPEGWQNGNLQMMQQQGGH